MKDPSASPQDDIFGHPHLWTVDRGPSAKASKGRLWTCFFIAVIYGALIEKLQASIPGRDPSALDIFFNALGAGGMVFWLGKREI